MIYMFAMKTPIKKFTKEGKDMGWIDDQTIYQNY